MRQTESFSVRHSQDLRRIISILKTGRLIRDDDNEESDEERIDMDINLAKRDQERRREQFLQAQDSDHELDEWENQQIRKGVTGTWVTLT